MHAVLLPEAFGLWLEACARWPPLNKPSQGYHSKDPGPRFPPLIWLQLSELIRIRKCLHPHALSLSCPFWSFILDSASPSTTSHPLSSLHSSNYNRLRILTPRTLILILILILTHLEPQSNRVYSISCCTVKYCFFLD
jgi:hypothetical protein